MSREGCTPRLSVRRAGRALLYVRAVQSSGVVSSGAVPFSLTYNSIGAPAVATEAGALQAAACALHR